MKFKVNELKELSNLHLHRDLKRKRKIKDFKSESGKSTQIYHEVSKRTIDRKTLARVKSLDK